MITRRQFVMRGGLLVPAVGLLTSNVRAASYLPNRRKAFRNTVDDTMRGWWSFDDGYFGTGPNEIVDRTGYAMNGTQSGTLTQATGHIDKAGNFNGTSQYVTCPNINNYGITGQLTAAAWIYPANVTNRAVISCWHTSGSPGQNSFILLLPNLISLQAIIEQTDNTTKTISYGVGLSTSTWHYVACVADGSNLRLYLNGSEVGTAVSYNGTINTSHSRAFNIGAFQAGGLFRFSGRIDEAKIWNRGLSAAEIAAQYAL